MRQQGTGVLARARVGGWATAAVIALALLASMLGGGRVGHATTASDGSAWLWSRPAGTVSKVNAQTGRVDRTLAVPGARGNRVRVTQDDRHLLIHDLDTGRVSSLDLNSLGLSGRADVGTRGDPHLAMGNGAAAVIERTGGEVRAVDPATLRPTGSVLRLPGPLVGGEFDGSGLLWVAVPQQGTVAGLKVTAQGPAVVRTIEVAEPGRDLALTVLDRGALVADRGGRDLVVAGGDGNRRRLTAPVPLAGAIMPDRTYGALAAVTVPAAGAVVTVADVGKGGPIRSFPLRDPVQEPAVPFAGKVYVAARETGQVRVHDPSGPQTSVLTMPSGRGDLELQVREGSLFVNAPGSPEAQVVGSDGRARTVGKYGDGTGQGGGNGPGTPPGTVPPRVAAPPAAPSFPEPADTRRPVVDLRPNVPDDEPPAAPSAKPGKPSPKPSGKPSPKSAPRDQGASPAPRTQPSTGRPASNPAPAPAASPPPAANPYSPQQVCNSQGGDYKVQRSSSFAGGRVYQLYSAATKKNCAVAMKTSGIGTASTAWVRLESQNGGKVASDSGSFKYYAGPVYLLAPGDCVRYSGGANGGSTSAGWANCG
ncbi:hypothetical protein F8568_021695 [Actinomadura sp. LD22]|uniref:Uncharacterized protein n=1 Tax=Actinomadura physcomitrii TaxID=2650748 RepID=A0A6I4MBA0_9ACTN|nr:hypothetical protein [Actinomadura physcomitrii]MWA02943.1 hypothetical protein [Actinomadura physcomitrii]